MLLHSCHAPVWQAMFFRGPCNSARTSNPVPCICAYQDFVIDPIHSGWADIRLLAPRAELRLLLTGNSTLIDSSKLSFLGEAVRALLVLEMRGLTLPWRGSAGVADAADARIGGKGGREVAPVLLALGMHSVRHWGCIQRGSPCNAGTGGAFKEVAP
eukprot:1140104-Pelagomonas_calceolata.AAC.6